MLLAPFGAWAGRGTLRVLRVRMHDDDSAELTVGYESYETARVVIDAAPAVRPTRRVRIPRHVAIIMDGNRRWAKAHGMPAIEGHRRGIVALRRVTRAASDLGVEALTVYGFSTENWNRDASEISLLFELCVYFARNELAELRRNNVRVRVIGDWEALPPAPRARRWPRCRRAPPPTPA